jgi:hypothetical protein
MTDLIAFSVATLIGGVISFLITQSYMDEAENSRNHKTQELCEYISNEPCLNVWIPKEFINKLGEK